MSVALVIGPLLAFVKPLYTMRERALIEYGRLASQHHLAFHHRWIDEGRNDDELIRSEDISLASDLNDIIEVVQQLRYIPVDFPAVLQSVIAASVPLLFVVATLIPIGEILKWLVGSVL